MTEQGLAADMWRARCQVQQERADRLEQDNERLRRALRGRRKKKAASCQA